MTALIPLNSNVQVPAVQLTLGGLGTVRAMAIDSSGNVYFVGTFQKVNGATRNGAAAITRYGVLLSWDPDLGGGSGYALLITAAGVYVGGAFGTVNGGTTRNNIALFDASTGTVQAFNPNCNAGVGAIAADSSNVYLGGNFTTCFGVTTLVGFAACNPAGSGSLLATLSDGISGGLPQVNAIISDGTNVLVAGAFDQVTTAPSTYRTQAALAQLNISTGYATLFNASITYGGTPNITALVTDGSGNYYIAGEFTGILSTSRPGGMAAFSGSTPTLNTSWAPVPSSGLGAVLLAVGGDIYWSTGTTTSTSICSCQNGATVLPWDPGVGIGTSILCMASDPANTTIAALYIGGEFNQVLHGRTNQDVRGSIAKVSTNTSNPTLLLY